MAKIVKFPIDTNEVKRRKAIERFFEPLENEFPSKEMRDCVRNQAIPLLDRIIVVTGESWPKSFRFPDTISVEQSKFLMKQFNDAYVKYINHFTLECFGEIIRLQIEICKLL